LSGDGIAPSSKRQRIGRAVEIGRHLAQTNEIGTARHPPQRNQEIAPQCTSRPRIARRRRPQHRRVVVSQFEIGEFNNPDAVLQPPNQRQQGDTLGCQGVRDHRDQRLDMSDMGERLVPCVKPTRILKQR
jgi:hypothetical protein